MCFLQLLVWTEKNKGKGGTGGHLELVLVWGYSSLFVRGSPPSAFHSTAPETGGMGKSNATLDCLSVFSVSR